VIIGNDIAICRDQKARSQRLRLPRLGGAAAKHLAKGCAGERVLHLDALPGGNIDHGGLQTLDHVGKAARRATGGNIALVLRGLGAQRLVRADRDGGAAQQKSGG
jgi:hypothetical protein